MVDAWTIVVVRSSMSVAGWRVVLLDVLVVDCISLYIGDQWLFSDDHSCVMNTPSTISLCQISPWSLGLTHHRICVAIYCIQNVYNGTIGLFPVWVVVRDQQRHRNFPVALVKWFRCANAGQSRRVTLEDCLSPIAVNRLHLAVPDYEWENPTLERFRSITFTITFTIIYAYPQSWTVVQNWKFRNNSRLRLRLNILKNKTWTVRDRILLIQFICWFSLKA